MRTSAVATVEMTDRDALAARDELSEFWFAQPTAHYAQNPLLKLGSEGCHRLFVSRNHAGKLDACSFVSRSSSRIPGLSSLRITRGPVAITAKACLQHLDQLIPLLSGSGHSLIINPFVFGAQAEQYGSLLEAANFRPSKPTQYADTIIVPVHESMDEQWRSLRRSTRTAINRARKAGVSIQVERSIESYRQFADSFNAFAASRGIAPLSVSEAAAIGKFNENIQSSGSILLSAAKDDQRIGEVLLMRNPGSLVYEWGWIADADKRDNLPVMHGLIFEALNLCRELGIGELDLGGYWRDRGAADPINQFKLGFSKQIRDYLPELELVLRPLPYNLHKAIRQIAGIIR